MMYGIDVFYSVARTESDVTALETLEKADTQLCGKLFRHLVVKDTGKKCIPIGTIATISDADIVCAVNDLEGLTTEQFLLGIYTDGSQSRN